MKHISKGMPKSRILALLMTFIMVLAMLPTAAFAEEASFSGGNGTKEDPYIITTAAQLAEIKDDLDAYYQLGNNIDLSDEGTWTPIGSFVADETVNDGETPDETYAFTGTFDGNEKTISGLTVNGDIGAGLFGCVAKGTVKDLTVENVNVSGSCMAAAVIGYAYQSNVENVTLTASDSENPNTITGSILNYYGYEMAPNMVAGLVGAGMKSTITDCKVEKTNLTAAGVDNATAWGENVHDMGLLGGGLESTPLEDCTVADSTINITGDYTFGIGGLSGCAMEAEEVKDCTVSGVTIELGKNAYLTGGLVGYSGQGKGKTALSGCKTENVTINVGETSSHIGGMIGGGFYLPGEIYRAVYPEPTSFDITDAIVSNAAITAGVNSTALGLVAGQAYQSTINATAAGTINGADSTVTCGLSEDKNTDFLYTLSETYQPLFEGATFKSEYNHYWNEYAAAVVGEKAAADKNAAELMKNSIGASWANKGTNSSFCCAFTNDIARLSFHGSVITGYDASGNVVFSHTYEYVKKSSLYGPNEDGTAQIPYMNLTIFKTDDADSGEFTYFAMCDDTPSTTYHIEFRYGSELNDLKNDNDLEQMYTGKYAYWLAAGIPTSADETMISNVIALFCAENLAEMVTDETAAQRANLVGTWYGAKDNLVFAADGSINGNEDNVFYAYDGKLITMIDDVCTAYEYTISGRTLTLYTVDGEKIATYTKPSNSHRHSSSSGKTTTKEEEPKQEEPTPEQPAQGDVKQTVIKMQIGSKIMYVNNVAAEKDAAPVIRNDRTLVPIRFITESLGGAAAWNSTTKEVTLTIDGKEIKMTIWKTLEKYGVAPVIIGDRTYVPVRFVADELDAATAWDNAVKTVTITKSEK